MDKIESKLVGYSAETDYKPFFEAIFKKDTIIMASMMQSLYTSFGMSIYEQMAVILAQSAGYEAERQYVLKGVIDEKTESLITKICQDTSKPPNKERSIKLIRQSIKANKCPQKDPESVVDVFVKKTNGGEVYIDITTVKPNKKEFRTLRKKMLRWCALRFSQDANIQIKTCIGIPYNPYYPDEYSNCNPWSNEYDDMHDILVQNNLWEEFAGYDLFDELLYIFNEAGEELKEKVAKFMENI